MRKSNTKSVRYHFSAPVSDTQIPEWIEKQHNFSTSIRIVLKDFIARHGMIDASCLGLSFDNADMTSSETRTTVQQPAAAPVSEPVITPAVTAPTPVAVPVAEAVSEKVPETIAQPEPVKQAETKEETMTTTSSMASSMLDDLMG